MVIGRMWLLSFLTKRCHFSMCYFLIFRISVYTQGNKCLLLNSHCNLKFSVFSVELSCPANDWDSHTDCERKTFLPIVQIFWGFRMHTGQTKSTASENHHLKCSLPTLHKNCIFYFFLQSKKKYFALPSAIITMETELQIKTKLTWFMLTMQ